MTVPFPGWGGGRKSLPLRPPTAALLRWLVASLVVTASACTTYRQQPIEDTTAAAALAMPAAQEIRERVAHLDHPLLAPLAIDLATPLSVDQVAVLAVVLHPALRAARTQRQLAQAQVLQAGLLPNPQLSAAVAVPVGAGAAGAVTAYSLGLSWDISALISRSARRDAARAQASSIDLAIAWQEWQVAEGAKQAFYALQGARERLVYATENQQHTTMLLEEMNRAYAMQAATAVDQVAIQTAAADAQGVFLDATAEVETARLALTRSLGLPETTTLKLAAVAWPLEVPDASGLAERLERRRLDLAALRLGYRSQEQVLRAAVLAQFPHIGISFSQGRDTSNVTSLGPGVIIDLPLFDRNQGVIASETATRQRLYDEYIQRVFDARHDLADALAQATAMRERIRTTDAQVALGAERVERYASAQRQGQLDAPTLATSRIDLNRLRLLAVTQRQQLAQLRIAIEVAAGAYLPAAAAETHP